MPLHGVFGYMTVGMASLGFVFALTSLASRSRPIDRIMYVCFILCACIQIPALISGVADNAGPAAAVASVEQYNFFIGGSIFTLACILVAWRSFDKTVTWNSKKWLVYQATALGQVLLAIALVWLGKLASTAT